MIPGVNDTAIMVQPFDSAGLTHVISHGDVVLPASHELLVGVSDSGVELLMAPELVPSTYSTPSGSHGLAMAARRDWDTRGRRWGSVRFFQS